VSGSDADDPGTGADFHPESPATAAEEGTEAASDTDPDAEDSAESSSLLGRIIGDRIGQAVRSEKTAGVVSSLEDRISAFRRERKIGKGTLRDTAVVAYRGYVAEGRAHTRVRVTEEPVVPLPAQVLSNPEVFKSNMRRFFALAFPGVQVRVRSGDATDTVVTARHGYATAHLPVGELQPGWHDYEAVTEPVDPEEKPARAMSKVLVPDPAAPVWVLSDIDDTVLQTGLAEGWTALRNTFMGQGRTRRAVPGMATLYRAIEGAGGKQARIPFFYLSTGSWALYDVLVEFLRVRGFPDGPLLLTDWGPQERYITRSGAEHKRTSLRRLVRLYPDARFVLIGDSGQRDVHTYADLAVEHPDAVAAIIIVDVGQADRALEVGDAVARARTAGVPMHYVLDAHGAAQVLAEHGVLGADEVAAVLASVERADAAERSEK